MCDVMAAESCDNCEYLIMINRRPHHLSTPDYFCAHDDAFPLHSLDDQPQPDSLDSNMPGELIGYTTVTPKLCPLRFRLIP
jgi:hypothetical protein